MRNRRRFQKSIITNHNPNQTKPSFVARAKSWVRGLFAKETKLGSLFARVRGALSRAWDRVTGVAEETWPKVTRFARKAFDVVGKPALEVLKLLLVVDFVALWVIGLIVAPVPTLFATFAATALLRGGAAFVGWLEENEDHPVARIAHDVLDVCYKALGYGLLAFEAAVIVMECLASPVSIVVFAVLFGGYIWAHNNDQKTFDIEASVTAPIPFVKAPAGEPKAAPLHPAAH